MFGGWPIEPFKELNKELQVDFWQDEAVGQAALERALELIVIKHKIQIKRDARGGTYLPLSVYAQQGFDTDRILAYCTDTEEHAELGLTPRVQLPLKEEEEVEEQVRKEFLRLKMGGKKRGRSPARTKTKTSKKDEKKKKQKKKP